jgi:hypothetical protein
LSVRQDCGFPLRIGKAAVLSLLAATLGSSCGAPPPGSHHVHANTRKIYFRPVGNPPGNVPAARLARLAGSAVAPTQLASARSYLHTWYLNGRLEQEVPSLPLPWPAAVPVSPGQHLMLGVDTSRQPDLVEVTITRAVPHYRLEAGSQIADIQCTPGENACWLSSGERSQGVRLPAVPVGISHIGVTALWYVPTSFARGRHLPASLAAFSATWLFAIQVQELPVANALRRVRSRAVIDIHGFHGQFSPLTSKSFSGGSRTALPQPPGFPALAVDGKGCRDPLVVNYVPSGVASPESQWPPSFDELGELGFDVDGDEAEENDSPLLSCREIFLR